ncbi:MAG: hypothetical protein JNL87_19795 [Burkholderiaceae bacterium]|nr:hypothetical protein [Burkholderiaceae bacterium]
MTSVASVAGRGVSRRLLAIVLSLGACSPALDWRQLRPDGWALSVSFPCRPAGHTRRVPLAGSPVDLTLLACSADGHTFAVASAELADPARVEPALRALGAAALANVQGSAEAERAAAVPGMTPHPAARLWQVSGHLPDGVAVREQVLVFAHGLRVFQATVVGPRADDALARPFFDSIEVAR